MHLRGDDSARRHRRPALALRGERLAKRLLDFLRARRFHRDLCVQDA